MRIPYRTRRALGRVAVSVLVIAVVLALLWLFWVIWLGRFVIYSDSGARFDFDRSSTKLSGEPAVEPEKETPISIFYNEGEDAVKTGKDLAQIMGYYVSGEDLKGGIDQVRNQLETLPGGTAVLVEVKNIFGEFFYSSSVGTARSGSVNSADMDALIKYLNKSNFYTIAKVPAFQDYTYGLNNVDDGLFSVNGAYLWRDDLGCYWLNPAREGTVSYLVQIANELRQLGFDEVVFDAFYFPQSENYRFSGDRHQTLGDTAKTLVTSCSTDAFAVSFVGDETFPLPEGRSRLFLQNVEASKADDLAQAITVPDAAIYLVFLTQVHDTRFDVYSVLRPITAIK